MYRATCIAVVIPAFQEEASIAQTIESIPSFVDHIIVVDDASSDRTHTITAQKAEVTLLRHSLNRGVGAAIATGYRHALSCNATIVAVLAGDGQMDPADLPALLDPLVENRADYSKGNRFQHPDLWKTMPPVRILGNILLSFVTKATSGYWRLFDSQCGYTAITTTAIEAIVPETVWQGYGYPNDLLARLHALGYQVVDVPVRPVYGSSWKSGIRLKTCLSSIPYVLLRSWLFRITYPLRHTMVTKTTDKPDSCHAHKTPAYWRSHNLLSTFFQRLGGKFRR